MLTKTIINFGILTNIHLRSGKMKRIFYIIAVCAIVVLAASVSYGQEYLVGSATTTGALNYVGPYDAIGTAVQNTFTAMVSWSDDFYPMAAPTLETANETRRVYFEADNYSIYINATWPTTVTTTHDHVIYIDVPASSLSSTSFGDDMTYTVRYSVPGQE